MLPLMSHVEHAPRALWAGRFDPHKVRKVLKRWDKDTDGRQTDALRLLLEAASVTLRH